MQNQGVNSLIQGFGTYRYTLYPYWPDGEGFEGFLHEMGYGARCPICRVVFFCRAGTVVATRRWEVGLSLMAEGGRWGGWVTVPIFDTE